MTACWQEPGEDFPLLIMPELTVATAVVTTVVSTVVSAVSFGSATPIMAPLAAAGISAAITLSVESTFAAADLAGGFKDWDEVGTQLAISAATSVISAAGGLAGSALNGIGGVGGAVLKTGVSVATSATSTVATKAIESRGDWNVFSESMGSFDTWSGLISSGAGSLVTNSLSSLNQGAGNIKVFGFNSKQIGSISKLNSTIGGLASTAITYGLTGEATFNVLNIADFINPNSEIAGASSGLLEVTIGGKKGFSSRLGTGGADISSGTLKTALAGLNNLNMNSKIKNAAKANGMENAATALRMQYGFGDEKQMQQLDDILNGKAVLKTGNGKGDAQTIDVNGRREVYLNNYKDNMTREEMLAMGITLGHEAYRDGVVGTEIEQINETVSAVLGHTAMADRVRNDRNYETIMKGIIDGNQNLKNDLDMYDEAVKNKDFSNFGEYVLDNYDYSADYWLLKTDGTIVWDGSKDLNVEYYDEWGNLHTTDKTEEGYNKAYKPKTVVKASEDATYAGTLAEYVGEERATQILASNMRNINDAGIYSRVALMDILGVSEEEASRIQHSGRLPVSTSDEQKQRLIGEALMAIGGMTWDGENRGNKDNFSISMSDHDIGQIVINKNADGTYDRFGITAEVYRDEMSYLSTRKKNGWNDSQGLDSIYLYKKDLNGNIIDSTIYEDFSQGWQTVANGFTDPKMKNQAYPSFNIKDGYIDNVYRGSTVVEDQSFYMRFGNFTASKKQSFVGNYFVINRAQTLSEGKTGLYGTSLSSKDRILGHSNYLRKYDRPDNGGLISASCFMNTQENVNAMNNWVMNNVSYSYDVKTIVKNKRNSIEPIYGPGRR